MARVVLRSRGSYAFDFTIALLFACTCLPPLLPPCLVSAGAGPPGQPRAEPRAGGGRERPRAAGAPGKGIRPCGVVGMNGLNLRALFCGGGAGSFFLRFGPICRLPRPHLTPSPFFFVFFFVRLSTVCLPFRCTGCWARRGQACAGTPPPTARPGPSSTCPAASVTSPSPITTSCPPHPTGLWCAVAIEQSCCRRGQKGKGATVFSWMQLVNTTTGSKRGFSRRPTLPKIISTCPDARDATPQ